MPEGDGALLCTPGAKGKRPSPRWPHAPTAHRNCCDSSTRPAPADRLAALSAVPVGNRLMAANLAHHAVDLVGGDARAHGGVAGIQYLSRHPADNTHARNVGLAPDERCGVIAQDTELTES